MNVYVDDMRMQATVITGPEVSGNQPWTWLARTGRFSDG